MNPQTMANLFHSIIIIIIVIVSKQIIYISKSINIQINKNNEIQFNSREQATKRLDSTQPHCAPHQRCQQCRRVATTHRRTCAGPCRTRDLDFSANEAARARVSSRDTNSRILNCSSMPHRSRVLINRQNDVHTPDWTRKY